MAGSPLKTRSCWCGRPSTAICITGRTSRCRPGYPRRSRGCRAGRGSWMTKVAWKGRRRCSARRNGSGTPRRGRRWSRATWWIGPLCALPRRRRRSSTRSKSGSLSPPREDLRLPKTPILKASKETRRRLCSARVEYPSLGRDWLPLRVRPAALSLIPKTASPARHPDSEVARSSPNRLGRSGSRPLLLSGPLLYGVLAREHQHTRLRKRWRPLDHQ
mmetsp:Transcript_6288/g.24500  ORF Transcript_6288/g.24500 Transcript_6288/m.24500 type:complete len:217 (-) Transcript_6288:1442-2092(-)